MRGQSQTANTAAVGLARLAVLYWLSLALFTAFPAWAEQRVRVGLYQNSPKVAISETGKPEGIFVDLVEAIAEKEGWTLEYVSGSWREGLDRLEAGQIDLMPDVAHSSERERLYAFHREPVLSNWSQVYARRGSGIRSLPDLEGRRVAVLEGSIQEDLFHAMVSGFALNVELLPQPDFAAAFRAVAEGKADAVVTNRFYGMRNAGKFGLEDSAIMFAPSQMYFAAPKSGNPLLLAAIDRHIAAFKKDSTSVYYRSLRRWTTDETPPLMPRWLIFVALGIAALLLVSLIWGLTLRRTAARLHASEQRQRQLVAEIEHSSVELTEAKRFMDAILDHVANPIFYKGPDLRFRGCNKAYERAFGVSRADFIGKTVLDLTYLPLADREAYQAEDAAAMAAGTTVLREAVIPFADGRDHQTLYSVSGFRSPDGSIVGLVGIIVDITPLKQAEVAMAEARQAAEAADRLKSAFLATMSHELRTPLNSIIGFTGIILQELAGPLNDEQKKQLGMVQGSARHLLALINDVLDISKIEAGELTVAVEPFDLAASIRKVAGIITPLAEKKGLALTVNVADGVGAMMGDARRVEQILLNLLGNAIKFTEAGSVTLTVEPVADHVPVEGAAPRPAVRLRVADSGIGIKPEDMAMLFIPFRQVDSAMTRQHDGTGLGLAICRRLAALMGGRIEAESRWGEGSEFIVTLPLRPENTGEPA